MKRNETTKFAFPPLVRLLLTTAAAAVAAAHGDVLKESNHVHY